MCHQRRGALPAEDSGRHERLDPCVLCSYDVDCIDVADLHADGSRTIHGISLSDLQCDWRSYDRRGLEPPSWRVARRLISEGHSGILVPSFAPGATSANLVLWKWGDHPPHQVKVYDPMYRLPKNPNSWK
jgi:RES domain-containing protein